MTIGEKVLLKSMPEEGLLEVIEVKQDTGQACLRFVDVPRCAVWVKESEITREIKFS